MFSIIWDFIPPAQSFEAGLASELGANKTSTCNSWAHSGSVEMSRVMLQVTQGRGGGGGTSHDWSAHLSSSSGSDDHLKP